MNGDCILYRPRIASHQASLLPSSGWWERSLCSHFLWLLIWCISQLYFSHYLHLYSRPRSRPHRPLVDEKDPCAPIGGKSLCRVLPCRGWEILDGCNNKHRQLGLIGWIAKKNVLYPNSHLTPCQMISHLTLEVERFYLSPTKDSYGNFMIAKMTLLLFGFLHLSFLQPGMKDVVKVDLHARRLWWCKRWWSY